MTAWPVKTQHAPSRHWRDARVYGHATTAMHDIEYTLLPHSQSLILLFTASGGSKVLPDSNPPGAAITGAFTSAYKILLQDFRAV